MLYSKVLRGNKVQALLQACQYLEYGAIEIFNLFTQISQEMDLAFNSALLCFALLCLMPWRI